jgi:hypothetical protein
VQPTHRCSLGTFTCGEVIGFVASDGTEFVQANDETTTEWSARASSYCYSQTGGGGHGGGGGSGSAGSETGTGGSKPAGIPDACAKAAGCMATGPLAGHGYCDISVVWPEGSCVQCPNNYLDCDGPAPEVYGTPGAGCETFDTNQGKCPK